jgi:hypothetical protein
MKQLYLFITCFLLYFVQAKANNLVIGANPTYNSTAQTLTFTISWDNSWSISSGPSNWDAVWVFIKRQNCSGNNNWVHQLVSSTSSNHTAMSGASTSTLVAVDAVTDGMGVFVKRIGTNVIGSVTAQTITLKLATTNPSITTSSSDNFEILGMEMVYVPQGNFYLGDGRTTNTSNFSAGNTNQPLLINSTIQSAGLGAYNNYTSAPQYGSSVALPSSFPLGYNGFYCMKYEISQGLVVEFLNTLTYDQQAVKTTARGASNLPNVDGTYFNVNWNAFQTYIATGNKGTYNTVPAKFSTTYPYIPENLSWQDLTSFLDWSGLRPMTEFEFEKACRGTLPPVANEYPWGNTSINSACCDYSATRSWTTAEGLSNYNNNNGPIRSGFAATSATNRSQAGATYYGIMEMGGNVFEQCIGGGNGYNYSGFTTTNGNGVLNTNGLADVAGWPSNGGMNSGTILKGGYHFSQSSGYNIVQVSDRTFYAGSDNNSIGKDNSSGGRGVRSF